MEGKPEGKTEVLYRLTGNVVATNTLSPTAYFFFEVFPVVRRTKCGCWVEEYGKKRFVLDQAKKKLAYPTKELARESFVRRKERQIQILNKRLEEVRTLLSVLARERVSEIREYGGLW